jgi:D-glycero-D-manno-heptose 1,7-bisphosphate phosphatase
MPAHRPAVFLDRDDTLIANREVTARTSHPGDLVDPALVHLLPGVAAGLRTLREAGFALVVVSNQGCIARGVGTVAQVEACNRQMRDLLRAEAGVELDGVYYCPYHPKGTVAPFNIEHPWRKPAPGMILAAAADLGLDLALSWMIGDSERDVQAANAGGVAAERAVLLSDGTQLPSKTAASFASAVKQIMG